MRNTIEKHIKQIRDSKEALIEKFNNTDGNISDFITWNAKDIFQIEELDSVCNRIESQLETGGESAAFQYIENSYNNFMEQFRMRGFPSVFGCSNIMSDIKEYEQFRARHKFICELYNELTIFGK